MKQHEAIQERLKEMKVELNQLFINRDNSTKNWEYQEYCLLICNLAKQINLLEWVLDE